MFTIWQCVVLAGALCFSIVGVHAQDNIPSALVTNEHERALAKHRLTVDNVRQLFAIDRELLKLMQQVPDLGRRMSELGTRIDPQRLLNSLVVNEKVLEGIPEIAEILQRHRITGREYVLTSMTAVSAEMMDESLSDEAYRRELEKSEIAEMMMKSQAVRFWRAMDPALKAEAAEWKRVREQMGRH